MNARIALLLALAPALLGERGDHREGDQDRRPHDKSGPYADLAAAARDGGEDGGRRLRRKDRRRTIEVIFADHQKSPTSAPASRGSGTTWTEWT